MREFMAWVKKNKTKIELFFLPAYAPQHNPDDIARALSAGANEFILKPFDRQGLTAKLASQLQPA